MTSTTTTDIACTVCGCVCDDLSATVRDGRIASLTNACALAEPWFRALDGAAPPPYVCDGREVPREEAVARAAAILRASRAPLVYGLSRSSTEGQRAAVRLAERLGGTIDTTASICHGPSIMAIQRVGESTSTLGEVRHRADLVVFWGADPAQSHPRHFERYSVDPPGMYVPRGRRDRTVVVVDVEETETVRQADLFVKVDPGRDLEALWWLRGRLRDDGAELPVPAGVDAEALAELHRLALRSEYGGVFFGLGIAQAKLGHVVVEALLSWVAEMNAHTRFVARRMRIPGDVSGADIVLCWQAGYPFAVDFSRGYPRHEPEEFSANGRLSRGEVDACVLVGSEGVTGLRPAAREHLARIPTIVLDSPHQVTTTRADVRFTTAVYGVHRPGTVYRMDEVPIPLRAFLPSQYPSDAEVLAEIEGTRGAA